MANIAIRTPKIPEAGAKAAVVATFLVAVAAAELLPADEEAEAEAKEVTAVAEVDETAAAEVAEVETVVASKAEPRTVELRVTEEATVLAKLSVAVE